MFTKSLLGRFILIISLLFLPLASVFAAAGCCSHHGGVKSCNTATNKLTCRDGSASPTCACNGTTSAKPAKKTTSTKKTTTTTTATDDTTTTATTSAKSTKGCCARHGGVASCDKASGYQMCKDGTKSATCKC